MGKDYQRLWKDVTNSPGKAEAVSALGEILTDKEGRGFISWSGRKQAELCTKVLDNVSREFHLPLLFQTISSGHQRVQPQTPREGRLPRHIEETC